LTNRLNSAISVFALLALTLANAGAADIEVQVVGVQPGKGKVLLGVYTNQAEFEAERMIDWRVGPAGKASDIGFVVTNLVPGRYGIAVYQDLNGNEVLDKTSLGVPTEPFGFSNNASSRLRPPNFGDFAFAVGEETIALEIRLE